MISISPKAVQQLHWTGTKLACDVTGDLGSNLQYIWQVLMIQQATHELKRIGHVHELARGSAVVQGPGFYSW
jgi:hypothetical protein